jgi:hypothetical protein
MDELFSSSDVLDILNLIDDGFLFERLGQEFLSARLGYKFLASGGKKDRGIDGLEYVSGLEANQKDIYQISIDKKYEAKIENTINKLVKNNIAFTRLTYLTNIVIKNKDEIIDQCIDNFKIVLRIYDGKWIADNANNSAATKSVISNFIKNHLRKYQKPGEGLIVSDYVSDPKLYVYLMHQVSRSDEIHNLNIKLIDTLITYSLRETDPDKNIFLSADEIIDSVKHLLNFEIERIESKINQRLKQLCKKPDRQINHHRGIDKYCLPYEARIKILTNNAKDKALYDLFYEEATEVIKKNLEAESVVIRDISALLYKIIEKIFYKQGLDFADFLLNNGCSDTFEGNLNETVDEILDESAIKDRDKFKIKDVLIVSIRHLIYHGSENTKQYLYSLSKTYLMLFLLKCDPSIVDFFQTMAGNLTIFVCTSILVPAFSEIYLEPQNQRYWSLLKSAKSRGVKLVVNETIISELDFHIKRSKFLFDSEYKDFIDFYRDDAKELVDQILVRAYIYALREGKATTYEKFIDNFITINGENTKQELIDFLSEEFGIQYMTKEEINIALEKSKLDSLIYELSKFKKSEEKAKNDAELILTIYALRKKNGEEKSSLDGYKTWWLSTDTMTHRSVCSLFKDQNPVSCYMRPDFLYNYISFTPPKEEVAKVYKKTFPNLLGMHISNHIPHEISVSIRKAIKDHSEKMDGRIKAKLRSLIDRLKSDPKYDFKKDLMSFFNE